MADSPAGRDFNPQRSATLSTNRIVVKHLDARFRRQIPADDPVKKRSFSRIVSN